ncbi:phosphotransferase [Candidatus Chlorohelix sp.]|uniref:phosphotransferase n=1 Tax=Candidatus Chlorohelix sp. TaxID=3139201 RepID=UPI003031C673
MSDYRLRKYRAAIKEQFPEFEIKRVAYLSEGWDSVACQINGQFIFRFPKRQEVELELLKEIALLPELVLRLPLPIPQFEFMAKSGGRYFPFVFVGYRKLIGTPLEDCPVGTEKEEWWKQSLGHFLSALHRFPIERARELGVRDMALVSQPTKPYNWRENVLAFYHLAQNQVYGLLAQHEREKLRRLFESYLQYEPGFSFEPKLIHADINPEHILLDLKNKIVSGIIDFGDCCIGDPALDIPEGVEQYYSGNLEEGWQKRSEFYRYLPPLDSIIFGLAHNSPALIELGINLLRDILIEENL